MRFTSSGLVTGLAAVLVVASVGAASDLRLIDAIRQQNKGAVRALLAQHVDVTVKQPDGATALHWAVHSNDLETASLLIRAGADVNAANDNGVTPLSLACMNGNAAIVSVLLETGANPNTVSLITGETALQTAARTGKADVVQTLLARGAVVDRTEPSKNQTALMWAAAEGHLGVVRVLVERGADVRARSKAGFTPLLFAARTGDLALVRLLLEKGADVNEAASDGSTALLIATIRRHTQLARFLLEQGADPNKGAGFTPLHWAAGDWGRNYNAERQIDAPPAEDNEWTALEGLRGQAKWDFIRLLLAYGADVNARAKGTPRPSGAASTFPGELFTGDGATPFWFATVAGDVTTMRLLVANGADPLLASNRQATPLMMAAGLDNQGPAMVPEEDALQAVKLCLQLGADITAADAMGETALHGAAYRAVTGSLSVIQFLVDHGAKVNAKNKVGWTPLAITEGTYWGVSDTRSDAAAALLRKLGSEPTRRDIERDGQVAWIKAGFAPPD